MWSLDVVAATRTFPVLRTDAHLRERAFFCGERTLSATGEPLFTCCGLENGESDERVEDKRCSDQGVVHSEHCLWNSLREW